MKKFCLLLLAAVAALALDAQSQSLTTFTAANFVDASGHLFPTGTFCVQPTDANGNHIAIQIGGGGMITDYAPCADVTNGAIVGPHNEAPGAWHVANPGATIPSGIYYQGTLYDAVGVAKRVLKNITWSGATFNLDLWVPLNGPVTWPFNQTVDHLQAGQLDVLRNLSFLNGATVLSFGSAYQMAQPGDLATSLNNATALLPSTGGDVYGLFLPGAQSCAGTTTITIGAANKPVRIIPPFGAQWNFGTCNIVIAASRSGIDGYANTSLLETLQPANRQISSTATSGNLITISPNINAPFVRNVELSGVRVGSTSVGICAAGAAGGSAGGTSCTGLTGGSGQGIQALDLSGTSVYNFGGDCVRLEDEVYLAKWRRFAVLGCGGAGISGQDVQQSAFSIGQFNCDSCVFSGNFGPFQAYFHSPASSGVEVNITNSTFADTPGSNAYGGAIDFEGTTAFVTLKGNHIEGVSGNTANNSEPDFLNAAIVAGTTNGVYNIEDNNFYCATAKCVGGVTRNAIAQKGVNKINLSGNSYGLYASGGPWGTNSVAYDGAGAPANSRVLISDSNAPANFVGGNQRWLAGDNFLSEDTVNLSVKNSAGAVEATISNVTGQGTFNGVNTPGAAQFFLDNTIISSAVDGNGQPAQLSGGTGSLVLTIQGTATPLKMMIAGYNQQLAADVSLTLTASSPQFIYAKQDTATPLAMVTADFKATSLAPIWSKTAPTCPGAGVSASNPAIWIDTSTNLSKTCTANGGAYSASPLIVLGDALTSGSGILGIGQYPWRLNWYEVIKLFGTGADGLLNQSSTNAAFNGYKQYTAAFVNGAITLSPTLPGANQQSPGIPWRSQNPIVIVGGATLQSQGRTPVAGGTGACTTGSTGGPGYGGAGGGGGGAGATNAGCAGGTINGFQDPALTSAGGALGAVGNAGGNGVAANTIGALPPQAAGQMIFAMGSTGGTGGGDGSNAAGGAAASGGSINLIAPWITVDATSTITCAGGAGVNAAGGNSGGGGGSGGGLCNLEAYGFSIAGTVTAAGGAGGTGLGTGKNGGNGGAGTVFQTALQ